MPSAIVLFGSVHIIKEDFWGNRAILSEIGPGEMFAETYACMPGEPLAVSAAAAETCSCLFLDFTTILATQTVGQAGDEVTQTGAQGNAATVGQAGNAGETDAVLLQAAKRRLLINLTQILAGKNLFLTKKMEHLTQRTTRQKLLSYLSDVQRRAGSAAFVFRLIVRSWRIFWRWTAVRCRQSCPSCAERAYWNIAKIIFF